MLMAASARPAESAKTATLWPDQAWCDTHIAGGRNALHHLQRFLHIRETRKVELFEARVNGTRNLGR